METLTRPQEKKQGNRRNSFNIANVKELLIGHPMKTEQQANERLTNAKALAVLSSDPVSSTAYGTEEIMLILLLAGSAALSYTLPIGISIVALVLIVATSYRQVVYAYPNGGGSYIVASKNLGKTAGLVAGASLATDYILTVAVSIVAGVAAITSAFPQLMQHTVLLCLGSIVIVTMINLRGVREAGTIFSIPTYSYIAALVLLIMAGFFQWLVLGRPPQAAVHEVHPAVQGITLFLILRAFSSGCATLTGLEAVSNGVQAFFEPVSKNAGKVMITMAILLSIFTVGIVVLCRKAGIAPVHSETVLSQLGRSIFHSGALYYFLQVTTALVLFMAANTAYNDFPRLSSIMARDGFLPRQFANLGDRLVFSNGIVILGIIAGLLCIQFKGSVNLLIPLYAVGVFVSFTLNQYGMVVHWKRNSKNEPRWLLRSVINAIGGTCTGIVAIVIMSTKFLSGAWMVVLLIPLLVLVFRAIRRHYDLVAEELKIELSEPIRPVTHTIIIPVADINRTLAKTISYARSLKVDVRCVHISVNRAFTEDLAVRWKQWDPGIPLTVIESPYRSLTQPLLRYIAKMERKTSDDMLTVMLPEFVVNKWWHHLLHNQNALVLKTLLLFRANTVVIDVPYHLNG
ncbi:MAG: APC family permease [Candidatus Eremiobacteraeota bacterium]|nr:APC family permease [Candidatus Eremiobacteraeota bacterium]